MSNPCHADSGHPDHSSILPRLTKARGQIAGIEKMIDERRYCVDILVQFRAAMSALRAAEAAIYEQHLRHCVQEALRSRDPKRINEKIDEISDLLIRRSVI